jgi:hypothetical protein
MFKKVAVWLVWLLTVLVGFYGIYLAREVTVGLMIRFGVDRSATVAVGYTAIILAAVAWLVYFIASIEVLIRRAGQPIVWRVLIGALVVEFGLLALYYYL